MNKHVNEAKEIHVTFSLRPAVVVAVLIVAIGCQATTSPSTGPSPSEPSAVTSLPSTLDSGRPSASATLELTGTIAFARGEFPDPEQYFTIRPDGSDERDLFSIEECSCLQFSPDASSVWTLNETAWGTVAFTTVKPDGTGKEVHVPPTKTLSLVTGPGAFTSDGSLIAFYGSDDTRPEAAGLYLAAPDLSGLRRVIGVPNGFEWITPYGISPDGSRVLFFAERGAAGGVTHTGDLFVVDATGDDLRKLNDDGWLLAETRGRPASLSPDGSRATFAAIRGDSTRSAVFVVALDGGQTKPIANTTNWTFSAAWAPSGERIAFATWPSVDAVNAIINADGSDRHDVSRPSDQVGVAVWSPDGKHLVVVRGPEGSRDVWIMDLDGNFLAQLTHQPGTYTVYDWR